ncbi:MAG TPA: hypothetical protein VI488_08910 [Candidatus Angelobacter sp.]
MKSAIVVDAEHAEIWGDEHMNTTVAGTPTLAADFTITRSRADAIPWYAWTSVLATVCISTGLYWDISWHMTIGRDTFWTPAHLLIQFGAVLGGSAAAVLIFGTTFGRSADGRASSVRILGLWGPLGAFLSAWGAAAMLISAPFDNWWHNNYGLDVKIISPPHQLLGVGIESINFGGIILMVGLLNHAQGALRRHLQWMMLTVGGLVLCNSMMGRLEFTDRAMMHSAAMYLGLAIGPPFVMETVARATGLRWARTTMAALYTIFFLLAVWIFPLFAAEPKLAPVYQHITHMIPLGFPVLLLGPAIALDLLWRKLNAREPTPGFEDKWLQATAAGVVFVAALVAAQWPFADFLMSPASRNWVFGTLNHPYMVPPEWFGVRNLFKPFEGMGPFAIRMALAVFAATMCTRLGIMFGNWMRKVQR